MGFAVENAVAQICREGGARVSTNIFLRDLDLRARLHGWQKAGSSGGRVVSFRGSQLAFDATLVSALHGNGIHRRNADKAAGIALREARRHQREDLP